MRYIINSTTTRTPGWQADCLNWASAHAPFELHGVKHEHLPFCQALSDSCHCRYHSRTFRDESVAVFEPDDQSESFATAETLTTAPASMLERNK
ncbi:MAG TPA: hypothetical protein VFV81_00445 [Verrucomicrobiae bacterium]|nr:hypothetical protein [Verrucomicrobiae bacterium]